MIRKLVGLVQAARTAPPSSLELVLGIACVVIGGRAVSRYVTHQQVILGQNLAALAQIKAMARQADQEAQEVLLDDGDPDYPAAEDLAPLATPPNGARRYMADEDLPVAEDIL